MSYNIHIHIYQIMFSLSLFSFTVIAVRGTLAPRHPYRYQYGGHAGGVGVCEEPVSRAPQ
ncbi:hypothetical protein EON63_25005 [archaeon]|nr:MAG: hypothetical protein EON63_25005 [archaeon]